VSSGFCAPIDERIHIPFRGEEREPGLIIRPSLGRAPPDPYLRDFGRMCYRSAGLFTGSTPGRLSTCVYTMV
jgi:hypothetical protein